MSLISVVRDCTQHAAASASSRNLYRYRLPLLGGGHLDLASRRGRPTLIVNTASQCGFAKQFLGLQALQERYADRGLLVVGCPSHDFGGLELEDPAEIGELCRDRYEITFPLTMPMNVRFAPHAFWQALARPPAAGPPVWNFNKYLLDGEGRVRGWWSTSVQPANRRICEAVAAALSG